MSRTDAIYARHYRSREVYAVAGSPARLTPSLHADAVNRWIAPALFDAQINGFAGVDFQQDALSRAQLVQAAAAVRAAGCSHFLLTLISDDWNQMLARLRHFRALRETATELRDTIAGWHLEGPFLSEQPGFAGAHTPSVLRDPHPSDLAALKDIVGNDPTVLTLAPERPGALEVIARARSFGITVCLGHTDAPAPVLREAVAAGAAAFTHLGNACPQQLDRHDNILWRVLDTPELAVTLIADGIHVSPALFRLVHRLLPPHRIGYVTDAMAAAAAPPGRYTIGRLAVEVGTDQVVRQPGKTNFAGSALRPIDGIQRAANMLDCAWQDVWDHFSSVPRQFLFGGDALPSPLTCLIETDAANGISRCELLALSFPN